MKSNKLNSPKNVTKSFTPISYIGNCVKRHKNKLLLGGALLAATVGSLFYNNTQNYIETIVKPKYQKLEECINSLSTIDKYSTLNEESVKSLKSDISNYTSPHDTEQYLEARLKLLDTENNSKSTSDSITIAQKNYNTAKNKLTSAIVNEYATRAKDNNLDVKVLQIAGSFLLSAAFGLRYLTNLYQSKKEHYNNKTNTSNTT